jgi:hypothetical protein
VSFPGEVGPPVLRFNIQPQDSRLDEAQIRRLLEEATNDAETAARQEHAVSAKLQVPGAFGGLGEITIAVHLLLPYLDPLLPYLKDAGKEVVSGVFTAAGEYFFHQYLAPRLRKRNLLPSRARVETETKAEPESHQQNPSEKPVALPFPKPPKSPKAPKKKPPNPTKPRKKKSQRRK